MSEALARSNPRFKAAGHVNPDVQPLGGLHIEVGTEVPPIVLGLHPVVGGKLVRMVEQSSLIHITSGDEVVHAVVLAERTGDIDIVLLLPRMIFQNDIEPIGVRVLIGIGAVLYDFKHLSGITFRLSVVVVDCAVVKSLFV